MFLISSNNRILKRNTLFSGKKRKNKLILDYFEYFFNFDEL